MPYSNKTIIIGTGSCVPDKIVTNEMLEDRTDTDSKWVFDMLGIRERRICADSQMTSDLAAGAAINAIESSGIDKEDIDLIILATATPDRKAPSTACLVKNKLGIRNTCPAFDIAAVCSGFMFAFSLASNMIQTGTYKNVLVIGADTFSKITDWNRRDCVFFGDGAGAVVLSKTEKENALFCSRLYSECENPNHFTVYPEDKFFSMNGREVYKTATTVLPDCVRNLLKENKLTKEDITHVIPHQPSIKILQKLAEVLDIPFAKVHTNMDRYANTSGATMPLMLDEANRKGHLKEGDLIVFAAIGSGWTWGAALYRW